ncbi:MAG: hypothetical protein WCF84_12980 [Anaerolineae bacterium]
MLEQIDLKKALSKEEYKWRMDALRLKMYSVSHAVYESHTPVVVVFEGWGAAGKGTTIAELTAQIDPRGFRVYPINAPRGYEERFPWLYRFWLKIPARGELAIFHSSWYRRVLLDRVNETVAGAQLEQAYRDIRDFERTLADDGAILVKFWLEIDKKEQKRRIAKLADKKSTAWQVSEEEQQQQEHHRRYVRAVEEMLGRTEAEYAPWTIVAATDRNWTNVRVFETIIAQLEPRVASSQVLLPPEIEEQLHTIERADGVTLTSAIAKSTPPANPREEADKTNA